MKIKLILFLLFLCIGSIMQAQTSKTVNVTAGNLYASLTETERNTITSLTITGSIDARDFKTMRDKMPLLNELDMSGTNIIVYNGDQGTYDGMYREYPANSIPQNAFWSTNGISKTNLNAVVFPTSLTSIGGYAFYGCSSLKSLTIPSSVVKIDQGAFMQCTGLTSLNLPSSITYLGVSAFSNCTGLTLVNLPSSLTTIGSAFNGCSGLTSITIPESVTKLEEGAFANCSGLTSITFPKSLSQLSPYAFSDCAALTSVTIPSWFTSISYGAFANCKNLKTVSILSPSTIIYDNAFENCINITSLALASTTPPGIYANSFLGVDRKLCTLKVPFGTTSKYRENIYWNSFLNISEPSNGISLFGRDAKVASVAGSMATVNIAANVSWTATSDQPWLTVSPGSGTANQTITFTVQANPTVSFRTATVTFSSTGFESKTFTITQNGIDACLTNVTPGSLITTLSSEELATITNLNLKGSIDARDFKTMQDKMPMLNTIDLSGVTIVAYQGTEGTLPNFNSYDANKIPERAFTNGVLKSKYDSIILPGSVTVIADNSFSYGLSSLTVNWQIPIDLDRNFNPLYYIQKDCILHVPFGTASIYSSTDEWKDFVHIQQAAKGFKFNTLNDTISGTEGSIVTVDITSNMAYTISSDQSWLVASPTSGNGNQKITLTAKANELLTRRKATVTVSGADVSSQSITIIQNLQPQPEKILELTAGGLANLISTDELSAISILTLKGSIDARDFKTMRDKMPLLTTLDLSGATIVGYYGTEGTGASNAYYSYLPNEIPERAFYTYNPLTGRSYGKSSLTSIVLPTNITSIGNLSFAYCSGLTTMNISSSVTAINNQAFDHCIHLTTVNIPSSVKTIEYQAFYHCEGLVDITIPSSVTKIGYEAFALCTNLASVAIAYGVKTIETNAFWFCNKLTKVSIPSSVTSLGSYAFYESLSLSQVTVNWSVPLNLGAYTAVFSNNQYTQVANLYVPFGTVSAYAAADQWKDFKNIHEMPGFFLLSKEVKLEQTQGSTSSVTINSNVAWTATSDQAWLTVSPASGNGIGQKLTFTAEANLSYSPRIAKVTVASPGVESQVITITQAQLPANIEITAGGLASAFSEEDLLAIKDLTIKGTIDARDFKTMRDKMPLLARLDLSEATIVAYNGSEGTYLWGSVNYTANKIPEYAFYKNTVTTNLTSITFPPSITSIGQEAFYNCSGLTNILIPPMVTKIETEAFYNCSNLTSVVIPATVATIEYYSFALCKKLNSITVESSIPPVAVYEAFYQVNYNLCALNVPYKSLESYRNAYQWRDFLKITEPAYGFKLSSNIAKVDGIAGSKATVTIDANIDWTVISDQSWLEVTPNLGTGTQTITLTAGTNPSFMESRTAYVTVSAQGMGSKKITVTQSAQPQAPKSFEISAGSLSTVLTAEELATVTDLTLTGSIDARDFKTMRDRMPLLAKLDLSKATIVAYKGTEGTSLVGNIDYPANTLPEQAFFITFSGWQGKASLTSVVLPESLTSIGQYSFSVCQLLTNVTIPPSVTTIGDFAFYGCGKITEMLIPAAITNIGFMALGELNCTFIVDPDNLNYLSSDNVLFNKAQTKLIQCVASKNGSYTIPATVTTIGDYAFYDRGLLTSVTIPPSVVSIGKNAFNSCRKLTTTTIPSSVTYIGEWAFASCYALNSLYTNSVIPVNLDASPNVFIQVNGCTLYVPIGSKDAYQKANQWKNFYKIVEINPDLIANAGPDKGVEEEKLAMLEGSAFVNTSGRPLTYRWTAPEGITLNSDTVANPTFTAPGVAYDQYFTFSLVISDGLSYSVADEVHITVMNVNKPPVANAGKDQIVNEYSIVTLDGSASFDPDNDYLYYEWTAPSPIVLNYKYSTRPTFKAPPVSADTNFIFYLRVNDITSYKIDTVVVTVKNINQAPVANAGEMQIKKEGETITLDATHSSDPDGDALTFLWTSPQGITLSSATSATPSFTAPEVEADTWFTIKLMVNDGKVNSYVSEVIVLVRNIPALLNLSTKVKGQTTPIYLNYKLYKEEENSFILKSDTFGITSDTLHLSLEPGNWIALVAPARDPLAFVPTYAGDVTDWNEAEIISMSVKSTTFREITCMLPEVARAGVGQISGAIYEKQDTGTKSISISKTNLAASNPPVQNALVHLYRKDSSIPVASVFTDYQGAYKFDKLEIADYQIEVEIPGYVQSERFPVSLSNILPATKIWFAVNTSLQVITDNNTIQLSLVKAYPNPTFGMVTISGLTGKAKIAVYSMEGKLILKKEISPADETVDLSNQVSGTYLFVINEQRFKIYKK
ncbi:MAG: leucine-rich repeat protein [Candidatus Saccharibacteria bacterium]